MLQKLLSYIREHQLIHAGERVGIGISGGADSVALLRALLELREELGIVISVIHFNHKIRGRESDADAEFVAVLAQRHGLEFHPASGDVPAYEKKHRLGTEAAARRLRYEMFRKLLSGGAVDKIATAHTRDDQAETVVLRLLRGAGTRGLAGIHPILKFERGVIIRPMLEIPRTDVEDFLKSLGQGWREDATNADVAYTRNRIRHELLPLIERNYNPNVREVLAEVAEIARDEDAFWEAWIEPLAQAAIESDGQVTTVRFEGEAAKSLAVRRRLLRFAAERSGLQLDFHHAQQVLELLVKPKGTEVELPRGWRAQRVGSSSIRLHRDGQNSPTLHAELRAKNGAPESDEDVEPLGYEYALTIPCEILIAPVRTLVRLSIVDKNHGGEMYNPASLLNASRLTGPLVLRNWRAGDKMRPLHRGSEEKLKRLFQEKKISAEKRPLWPVLASAERIVWAKEFGVAAEFAATPDQSAVRIEVEERKVSRSTKN
ncbi:MAG TPA: tRNA lysidine(34) synthetase TilS [Terriglobales bacterium]|nr:tRNA lysidine(34) synthetase TilS [Terriglobales bacterium]